MTSRKIITVTFLLFQVLITLGQSELALICSTNTKANQVKIDVMNNIYLISYTGITKQSLCENSTQHYSFIYNSDDVVTDVSNPFKLFIFYKNYHSIEYINNQLSSLGNSIKMTEYTNENVTLACPSYDNGIWVYSFSENILVRYNSSYTKTHQSNPIEELYTQNYNPTQLFEKNEQIYLGIPNFGILVFDKYGTYQKRIPLAFQKQFSVIGSKYYYIHEKKLMAYDSKTFEEAIILEEENDILSFDINTKYISLITQNGMYKLYQIPLN